MKTLLLLGLFGAIECWFYGRERPDAWTVGGVWPLPQTIVYGKANQSIHPSGVFIDAFEHKNCDIIVENAKIYLERWMFPFDQPVVNNKTDFPINILIKEECPSEVPHHYMNEEYKLRVSANYASIEAQQVWGALRALETVSQLIYYDENEETYKIRTTEIHDFPRFSVRGIMLDTSRHFLSVKTLKRQLDLMAQSKLNVFHWHIVDSESFPYDSKTFPILSKVGAYTKRHVYSQKDVKEIIDYARLRGIRVMPEFDTPGHTSSWRGQDGLLTDCFDKNMQPTNLPNLIDPTKEESFTFLSKLFEEIGQVFPDQFVHLGGDEISDYLLECWTRNPKVQEFMRERGFANNTMLENYYFGRLQKLVKEATNGKNMVFWQEVFDHNNPDPEAIIHIWKGNSHTEIAKQAQRITAAGHPVIISACWYLNYIKYGADWKDQIAGSVASNSRYYYCDPTNFEGTPEQKSLVLGGIAALWGEFVDATNIEARLWPRASAVAERLWSPASKTQSHHAAWPRLHELRCRQVARGYRVQPINWPDYCPFEWKDE